MTAPATCRHADERLTRAMFHYCWHYAVDIDRAGEILPRAAPARQRRGAGARRERYVAVSAADRTATNGILNGTGCEVLFRA